MPSTSVNRKRQSKPLNVIKTQINMKFNNKVLTLGLVVAFLQMPATSFAQGSGANRQNPLLQKSS